MNVEHLSPTEVGAWSTAIAAAVGGAALLRRRWARDGTEISKDKAESRFLDRALDERDEALRMIREVLAARQVDAALIATLREQLQAREREGQRLQMEFDAFKRRVLRMYPETRQFVESAFAPLDGPPLELPPLPRK